MHKRLLTFLVPLAFLGAGCSDTETEKTNTVEKSSAVEQSIPVNENTNSINKDDLEDMLSAQPDLSDTGFTNNTIEPMEKTLYVPATDLTGFTKTDTGLQYRDVTEGEGQEAKAGDLVSVHYTGTLKDGTKFDSSVDRGTPFQFNLGGGMVIAGWDEGVEGMKIGGTRVLVIPSDLGYGDRGAGGIIGPGAELHFQVELMKISGGGTQ